MPKLSTCPEFIDLQNQVNELEPQELVCETFCPLVVGETEGVDSPVNLNPAAPTQITWGGWQSQDESVVATSGDDVRIASDDVCAAHVTGSVTFVNDDAAANAQRAHPELWLLKDGQRVALAQTYIRDNSGQDSDTATISWYDTDPVAGSVYTLEVEQDSIGDNATGQGTAALEIYFDEEIANYLQVAAHRKFEICKPDGDSDGGGDPGGEGFTPLFPAANGKVVSDNFQDGNGNAPFNLQVRNTQGDPVNWQACTPDVGYSTIPNLQTSGANYQVIDNGDGTFKHCFDGTGLGGFQNITITGGVPSPAGNGGSGNLDLYCQTA